MRIGALLTEFPNELSDGGERAAAKETIEVTWIESEEEDEMADGTQKKENENDAKCDIAPSKK